MIYNLFYYFIDKHIENPIHSNSRLSLKCGTQPVECASCPIIPRGADLRQSSQYIQQSRLALLFLGCQVMCCVLSGCHRNLSDVEVMSS